MKLYIRSAGKTANYAKGQVLAELDVKQDVVQEDLDFLRAKMELTVAELYSVEVVARYDFEELAKGPGLTLQMSCANPMAGSNPEALAERLVGITDSIRQKEECAVTSAVTTAQQAIERAKNHKLD